jgi:hypothetical protein
MNMIGLDRQPNGLPTIRGHYRPDDLPKPIPYQPHEHLAAPLATPDDVVHDKV